ncbi:MAG: hypothetical protein U0547_05795 [Dehalococcoidia bacterium]
MTLPRVSPPNVFATAAGAAKPAMGSPGADAHRQTGFVLGGEIDLVLRGLALEGACAEATAGAKFRKQRTAAVLGPWSRSWLCRLEALHAVQVGNYAAAIPLVRTAADYQAALIALLGTDAPAWEAWLEAGGIALAPDVHATEFRLHAFRSGEVLAAHPTLGPLYRVTTDLSLSHFGSTLLLAGNESAPDHVTMTFGDRDFHTGLAQLALGWLLELSAVMAETLPAHPDTFGVPAEAELAEFAAAARATVAGGDRCAVETIERDGERRYLVRNWRRTPGAAAKRILL